MVSNAASALGEAVGKLPYILVSPGLMGWLAWGDLGGWLG